MSASRCGTSNTWPKVQGQRRLDAAIWKSTWQQGESMSRDEEIHLTPIEYKLLTILSRHAGRVLTHRQLLEQVWGPHQARETHYLRIFMASLRRKLEVRPGAAEVSAHRTRCRISNGERMSIRCAAMQSNKPQVVLIEDDAPLQKHLRTLLSGAGYRVEAANDGTNGLELAALRSRRSLYWIWDCQTSTAKTCF